MLAMDRMEAAPRGQACDRSLFWNFGLAKIRCDGVRSSLDLLYAGQLTETPTRLTSGNRKNH